MHAPLVFTPEYPCRCGHDGAGFHRCHAGRPDPVVGEDGSRWCTQEAVPRLRAYPTALGGQQLKFGVQVACYCDDHYVEACAVASSASMPSGGGR